MVSDVALPISRKILLFLIEFVVKILWIIDGVTSLNLGYILKTLFRAIVFALSLSFIIFLIYSLSTGYLHKLMVAYMFPDDFEPSYNAVQVLYPLKVGSEPSPETTAVSAIVMDRKKGKILLEKNPEASLAPASTAKLMTALVALDIYNLDEDLTVSEYCTTFEGAKAWLPKDSKFKVKDLLESMLIGSAGDSACVLATSKFSEVEFIEKMNEKAKEIGMDSTHFSNPVGFDDALGNNYSTVLDLYKLSVRVTSIPEIKETVKKKSVMVSSVDRAYNSTIVNTNRFLWEVPNTIGIKTGTTPGAGEVLIYEYADTEKNIVIVVMGSKDRFSDTRDILKWVGRNYAWK